MKINRLEYIVTLYQDGRAIGVTRRTNKEEADRIAQDWQASDERKRAKVEALPLLEEDYLETIAMDELLTQ